MKSTFNGGNRWTTDRPALWIILLLVLVGLMVPTAAQGRLFVTNPAADSVVVIDPATNLGLGSIAVGDDPGPLALGTAGNFVYVPNRGDDSISVIDVATQTVVETITHPSFSTLTAIAVRPGSAEIWIVNRTGGSGSGSISIYNTGSKTVSQVITDPSLSAPTHLAINPTGTRAYVVNSGNATLSIFVTFSRLLLLAPFLGGTPGGAVVSQNGGLVLVANPGAGGLSRVQTNNSTVSTVPLGGTPRNPTIRGDRVFVPLADNRVGVYSTQSGLVSHVTFPAGPVATFAVGLVTGSDIGYVSDAGQDRILGFRVNSLEPINGSGFPLMGVGDPRHLIGAGSLASADLELVKTTGAGTVFTGTIVTFNIAITNHGPTVAQNVVLTDELDDLQFVSADLPQGDCEEVGGDLVCDLGTIEVDQTVVILLRLRPTAAGTVTNVASVEADEPDPDPGNNSDSAAISTTAASDLTVSIIDTPDPVVVGEPLTYQIRVQNLGFSLADRVRLTAQIPPGSELVSVGGGGSNCSRASNVIFCNLGALLPSQIFNLELIIIPGGTGLQLAFFDVQNTVLDSDPSNNQASAQTLVTSSTNSSDLQLLKQTPLPILNGQSETEFELTITNNGPDDSPGSLLTDFLPDALELVSAETPPDASCEVIDSMVFCRIGGLLANASVSLTLRVGLAPSARGVIVNRAEVDGFGNDPDSSNNLSEVQILVRGGVDFNGDGVVNAGDLQMLIFEINDGDGESVNDVGRGSFQGTSAMDVNGDGLINREDAAVIVRLIFAR